MRACPAFYSCAVAPTNVIAPPPRSLQLQSLALMQSGAFPFPFPAGQFGAAPFPGAAASLAQLSAQQAAAAAANGYYTSPFGFAGPLPAGLLPQHLALLQPPQSQPVGAVPPPPPPPHAPTGPPAEPSRPSTAAAAHTGAEEGPTDGVAQRGAAAGAAGCRAEAAHAPAAACEGIDAAA